MTVSRPFRPRFATGFLLACVLVAAGCSPRSIEAGYVNPYQTTYSRDEAGNCYATMGSKASNGLVSQSFTVPRVDCTPAVLALVPASQGGGLQPDRR